jgi:two-component system invasion response regulator UvrY
MINVLLVDDHELVRTGIAALLNAVAGISVVGVASCGEQALIYTEQLFPDIILMDVNMPGMGGMEACRRIVQAHPNIKIIALSAYNDNFIPGQLLKLGAKGFLSKNSPVDEMVSAIRKVMAGESYLCKEVLYNLTAQTTQGCENSPFSQLSKREAEVACLILQGLTIQEMAQMLDLSDKTINTYRYRLYEKLNVKNDVELTRLAVKSNYADSGLMLNDLTLKKP